ncbi:MAG: ExbD/TolR family protein [Candidatus Methylacidiphilales bacterium]|nr:biopolymer transporter ExbD [Candidatus Methylacidiphilales bacterium]
MSRKHKKHVEDEPDPEFQVAPMVDVLLVLLMFFMSITSTEVLKKVADLQLPEAIHSIEKKADGTKQQGEVVINVSYPGPDIPPAISIDQVQYSTVDALGPVLADRLVKAPNLRVLIRADEKVEYRVLADIMKAVGAAKIGNVTFAVLTAQPKPTAPAPH